MKIRRRQFLHLAAGAAALPAISRIATAQTYYWAQLTTCTPTWLGQAVEVSERMLLDFIPAAAEHVARQHPEDREYIENAIAEGRIKPNVDDDYIKGILTQQCRF